MANFFPNSGFMASIFGQGPLQSPGPPIPEPIRLPRRDDDPLGLPVRPRPTILPRQQMVPFGLPPTPIQPVPPVRPPVRPPLPIQESGQKRMPSEALGTLLEALGLSNSGMSLPEILREAVSRRGTNRAINLQPRAESLIAEYDPFALGRYFADRELGGRGGSLDAAAFARILGLNPSGVMNSPLARFIGALVSSNPNFQPDFIRGRIVDRPDGPPLDPNKHGV